MCCCVKILFNSTIAVATTTTDKKISGAIKSIASVILL